MERDHRRENAPLLWRFRACLKSLLGQSSAATDRFRSRHRPVGLGRGNRSSCPKADVARRRGSAP